jgi:hypothetical protein
MEVIGRSKFLPFYPWGKSSRYTLNRRLGEYQNFPELFGGEKNIFLWIKSGPVRTVTCSLPFIKYDVPDVNLCIILVIKLLSYRDVFNKKKHVLSTTVQILDVITSFNLNCYPVMMDQPRAAILFRRHGNWSRDLPLTVYRWVTSRVRSKSRVSLWRHLFTAEPPVYQRNQRRYHVKKSKNLLLLMGFGPQVVEPAAHSPATVPTT